MNIDKKVSRYGTVGQIGKKNLNCINSKVLNKIFDKNLYSLMKSRLYELELNGNKELFNIAQLEGFARQGNEEADSIVQAVSKEIDELLAKYTDTKQFDSFDKYILEMANIIDKANKERDVLEADKTRAVKAWDDAKSRTDVKASWTNARKTEYLEALEKHEESCKMLYESTKQELEDLRNDLYIRLQLFYGLNGDLVDDNTMKLLQANMTLTEEEYDSFAFRFRGNPTMLRVINEYAVRKKVESKLLKEYMLEVKHNSKKVLDVFDRFKSFCLQSVSNNSASRNAVLGHLDRLGAEALKSLEDITVKPM